MSSQPYQVGRLIVPKLGAYAITDAVEANLFEKVNSH